MHLEKTLWQKNACPFKSLLYCALESATSLENWNFLCGDVDGLAVRGLRPLRAFLLATLKVPKPTSVTALPFFSSPLTAFSSASTAAAASFLLQTALATASISSLLFILFHPLSYEISRNFAIFYTLFFVLSSGARKSTAIQVSKYCRI